MEPKEKKMKITHNPATDRLQPQIQHSLWGDVAFDLSYEDSYAQTPLWATNTIESNTGTSTAIAGIHATAPPDTTNNK